MAAVCEKKLNNGCDCDVEAIGRCATCGEAFCRSHQAWRGQTFYIDQCASCLTQQKVDEEKRQAEVWVDSPFRYFLEGIAQTDLLTTGVPTVEVYEVRSRWEPNKGIFARGGHNIDVATPIGRAWILGEFKWTYGDQGRYESKAVIGNWLTAMMSETDDAFFPMRLKGEFTVARVRPYPPGYELLYTDQDSFSGDLEETRRAVQRLIRNHTSI